MQRRTLSPGVDCSVAPRRERRDAVLPMRIIDGTCEADTDVLRVVTWNIGFGSGPHQETLADRHPRELFVGNLNRIVALARDTAADVMLLQEVDLGSKRSHRINQLEYLQDQLGWSHATYVESWNTFVPLMGIGRVRECAAIISRYPLHDAEGHIAWFDPAFRDRLKRALYRPFVWGSPMMHATLEVGGRSVHLFNVHLDVFQRAYRKYQVELLAQWMHERTLTRDTIIGGDFNYHAVLRTYDAHQRADELLPPAFEPLWTLDAEMKEAFISASSVAAEIHAQVTFPEHGLRHDFLFHSAGLDLEHAEVLDARGVSDHRPVLAQLRCGNP